jgi:hypothetical protein
MQFNFQQKLTLKKEKGANLTELKAFIESARTMNLSSVTKDKDKQDRFEGFCIFSIN